MQEEVILQIDRAALTLVQSIDDNRADLNKFLDTEELAQLQADLDHLRQLLLGLEFGALYHREWDSDPEELESAISEVSREHIPVEEAAAHVAEILSSHHPQEE